MAKTPLVNLDIVLEGIRDGSILLEIGTPQRRQLEAIFGSDYRQMAIQMCLELTPSDFSGRWACDGVECADVYGLLRDSLGRVESDELYAFYIKIGHTPEDPHRRILSCHPTSDIWVGGIHLRTTVEEYDD